MFPSNMPYEPKFNPSSLLKHNLLMEITNIHSALGTVNEKIYCQRIRFLLIYKWIFKIIPADTRTSVIT